MPHSRTRIARVQARAFKRAKADDLSPDDIERVKRSGEAAVAFARQVFNVQAVTRRR